MKEQFTDKEKFLIRATCDASAEGNEMMSDAFLFTLQDIRKKEGKEPLSASDIVIAYAELTEGIVFDEETLCQK